MRWGVVGQGLMAVSLAAPSAAAQGADTLPAARREAREWFRDARLGWLASTLPLETSLTTNNSWGFNIADTAFKSVRELVGYLVRAADNDANLLLNVGPHPDGTIQPQAVERLEGLGRWLTLYGASVYGTRGGPVPPRAWDVTTQRGDTVFVHVLDWPDRTLALPPLGRRVRRAGLLAGGAPVPFTQSEAGVMLTLPPAAADEPDQVVVLEMTRSS